METKDHLLIFDGNFGPATNDNKDSMLLYVTVSASFSNLTISELSSPFWELVFSIPFKALLIVFFIIFLEFKYF
ncbi:hypothetical protein IC582_001336 [Cucumis melo]